MTNSVVTLLILVVMVTNMPNSEAEFGRVADRTCWSKCLIAHHDCHLICNGREKVKFPRCYMACVREDGKCNQKCRF
ncbi:hypothetical protein NP493_1585g00001 [Ridgeia piscesae]|uniref:Uncharacterized protein n=1 Tax=Ridgeia piscesae TaxID=27915 RepID=A0AAD9NAV5_RIDPI|nr:hypothetical protein NP493_1585g00001 [Ridgeia piscesae]